MEKRDWIWIAIKVFGIFLLVKAVIALPDMLGGAYQAFAYRDWEHMGMEEMKKLHRTIYLGAFTQMIKAGIQIVICGGVGLYFVRSGAIVFHWVFPSEDAPK